MKVVLAALSALLFMLVFAQAVEAKKKVPANQDNAAKVEEIRPPLDNTSTGGIRPAAEAKAPATDGSQYPPALYLNFQ
ncbi:hypothetical protein [Mesorhizobium sp. 131-2-1]|uniref:hypothetical protein n=1 Tax=Mesorhizobium sp. 131-2-1 TaxID=2744518 RepID=UPI001928E08E|nr:hypothetical protein [Mesorhizobium sp. 131-2-1]BCG95581.1 hypothetical protein MesoLj131a_44450 [Mesorhizobium sp. 131-2-1]